jgi:hypothetical protein
MIKIEKLNRLEGIAAGDIVVKYPLEGVPTDSFALRNTENSIAYEVAENNASGESITLVIPSLKNEAEQQKQEPLVKRYSELVAEKIWWVANY